MEYLIGGLIVWALCGLVTIFTITMPMHKSLNWDFNIPVHIIIIVIFFGPFAQIPQKKSDNECIIRLARGE